VPIRHWRKRAVERKDLQAVTWQIELTDDLGPEQRHHVRTDGIPESGEDFFGDRRAAKHMAALEDEYLLPGAREIGGGGESVVPSADDDCVVTHCGIKAGPRAKAQGLRARQGIRDKQLLVYH